MGLEPGLVRPAQPDRIVRVFGSGDHVEVPAVVAARDHAIDFGHIDKDIGLSDQRPDHNDVDAGHQYLGENFVGDRLDLERFDLVGDKAARA